MRLLKAVLLMVALFTAQHARAGDTGTPLREVTLEVKGMICASCANAVEKALRRVDGVAGVRVDTGHDRAVVTYDAAKVTPQRLAEAVRKAGYRAEPPREPGGPAHPSPGTAPQGR